MLLFTRFIFVILAVEFQKTLSQSMSSCESEIHLYYKNITSIALQCYTEKDKSMAQNIFKHLDHVRTYLDVLDGRYKRLLNITSQIGDKQQYLGNPMNTFSVLRRAAKDWNLPLKITQNLPVSYNPVQIIINRINSIYGDRGTSLFKVINLTSGFRGLSLLQSVYHISADTLANGKLDGALSHTIMSIDDCFEFAQYCYYEELNYSKALEWLDQTLFRLEFNKRGRVTEKAVLELYFLALCFTGDFNGSKLTYEKLIARYNKFTPSLRLLEDFEIMSKYGCKKAGKVAESRRKNKILYKNQIEEGEKETRAVAFRNLEVDATKLFELCNHPHNVYSGTARFLKCRFIHYNKPALKIKPFKVEEYHLDPPVLLIHDVISEKETAQFLQYGKSWTKTSTELYPWISKTSNTDGDLRTSDSFWLFDHNITVAAQLMKRASDLSGWSTYKAKPLQLVTYGAASSSLPQIDTTSEESTPSLSQYGDYSAIMFHLNDVDKGGYTIFPALNVTVAPAKGSALLWFSRKPDGTSDPLSLHAGCPVLQGSKWILNKWFHPEEQTFPRCSKKKNSSFKLFYMNNYST